MEFLIVLLTSGLVLALPTLKDEISREIREQYCGEIKQYSDFCERDDEIPDFIWEMHFTSVQLCKEYYKNFHGVENPLLTDNTYLAAGGAGMVSV